LTTLELVDALEAGIAALRSSNGTAAPHESNSIPPAALLAEMERCGLTAADIAAATDVSRIEIDAWLSGVSPIPNWLAALVRVTALLPLPARRRLNRPAPVAHTHPFSRIEDL